MQFVAEFIVESVDYLERIANAEPPPLEFDEIERIKFSFDAPNADKAAIRESLQEMEVTFRQPGDLSSWTPELLDNIDDCFVNNYLDKNGDPVPCLFFPDNPDNLNTFRTYCSDVDDVLRLHTESAPTYAREYFSYYTIWQMRGWSFPVPLGTASVVGVLNKMAMQVREGFSEVSFVYHGLRESSLTAQFKVISWLASSVSWAPRLNSKVFISRDQYDSMIDAVTYDPTIKMHSGMQKKVVAVLPFIPFFSVR